MPRGGSFSVFADSCHVLDVIFNKLPWDVTATTNNGPHQNARQLSSKGVFSRYQTMLVVKAIPQLRNRVSIRVFPFRSYPFLS